MGGGGRLGAPTLSREGTLEGTLPEREFLVQPAPPPSQVPGLASVPRSQRHLQPPAPAHVGPEAGGELGALSLIPAAALPGTRGSAGGQLRGAALCWPPGAGGCLSQWALRLGRLSVRWPDLNPPALRARGAGVFRKTRPSFPGVQRYFRGMHCPMIFTRLFRKKLQTLVHFGH